ncbi:MAG TPA: hypothetical protein VJ732_03125 [Bryobacteraceae bacterium]|nr:hypothetical protein [Bryobacteraceae bacterium]
MRGKLGFIGVFACAVIAVCAWAQEGHPLTGSWHGDWGTSPTQRNHVVLYMKWDTKNIVGMINPGPNAMPLKVATLDPTNWTVHFEADGKDKAGNPVHVVIDGKLDNIGSYNRTITGTWTEGSVKGDFKVTRDS